MNAIVEITPAAIESIRKFSSNIPNFSHVRLGIRGGGCAGYSYVVEYESHEKKKDDVVCTVDNIEFRIDKRSAQLLDGSIVDYIDEPLKWSGFKFTNPRAKSACGCGISFDLI